MVWFRAFPADEKLASVDLLLSDDTTAVIQVGSGEWHTHPGDVDVAIEMARQIIGHELCVLEEYTAEGRLMGSGPIGPDGNFKTLRLDATYLMRRFFGRVPVREEVDFSRYVRGRHLYVDKEHVTTMQAAYAKLGRPAPSF